MTVQQFLSSEAARRRYWVGSHLGWRAFAAARTPGERIEVALERADEALYEAKRQGRNQLVRAA